MDEMKRTEAIDYASRAFQVVEGFLGQHFTIKQALDCATEDGIEWTIIFANKEKNLLITKRHNEPYVYQNVTDSEIAPVLKFIEVSKLFQYLEKTFELDKKDPVNVYFVERGQISH